MNRGIDHGVVFFDDSDRVEFGSRLADIHERFGVTIHAYCLMSTHFHALIHCPNGHLSQAMQRLGSMYTRHVNDRLERDGALFRGRFASRVIDNDRYLLAACRYIHRNPLVIPGVARPDHYRWSSHRTYLGLRPTPSWLRTDEVMAHLGNDVAEFDRFVTDERLVPAVHDVTADQVVDMVDACVLVLDEVGGGASSARIARMATLVWADAVGADRASVMDALRIDRVGGFTSAMHRARSRANVDPAMAEVVRRAGALVPLGDRSRLGSDPWRDQRAARAAS
jgi:REP element-mobilizing transposase RayT